MDEHSHGCMVIYASRNYTDVISKTVTATFLFLYISTGIIRMLNRF